MAIYDRILVPLMGLSMLSKYYPMLPVSVWAWASRFTSCRSSTQ